MTILQAERRAAMMEMDYPGWGAPPPTKTLNRGACVTCELISGVAHSSCVFMCSLVINVRVDSQSVGTNHRHATTGTTPRLRSGAFLFRGISRCLFICFYLFVYFDGCGLNRDIVVAFAIARLACAHSRIFFFLNCAIRGSNLDKWRRIANAYRLY